MVEVYVMIGCMVGDVASNGSRSKDVNEKVDTLDGGNCTFIHSSSLTYATTDQIHP